MINVTKTYLPNREKYQKYIDRIFQSGWLTNNGELVQELEKRIAEFCGVPHIVLTCNGTVALQVAYRLLGLQGEVVTTPFTFVATTSSLIWEGLKPIFADIDPATFNIDPAKVIKKVTARTSAIVGVHVYGNVCEVEALAKIASQNKLKVIYDAAHAFGVNYRGKNIANYGDIVVFSFHATKIFHTIEGGALAIRDANLAQAARLMINFGIPGPDQIATLGINCKMNEFQAAMGLCVLDDFPEMIRQRRIVHERYLSTLAGHPRLGFQQCSSYVQNNFSYFPLLFDSEKTLLEVRERLNAHQIFPRRYFYPSLDTLAFLKTKQKATVSRDIATRILCLPVFESLSEKDQENIIKIVLKYS